MVQQLCGSPLDQLPCDIEDLPTLPGYGSDKMKELIQERVNEVRRRSIAVENHWSLNRMKKTNFGELVSVVKLIYLRMLYF